MTGVKGKIRDMATIAEERRVRPNLVNYMERKGLSQAEIAAFCRNEWRASDWSPEQPAPDNIPTDEDVIERHSDRYFSLLQNQLDASEVWPARFVFPRPQNNLERKAFDEFLHAVRHYGRLHVEPIEFTEIH